MNRSVFRLSWPLSIIATFSLIISRFWGPEIIFLVNFSLEITEISPSNLERAFLLSLSCSGICFWPLAAVGCCWLLLAVVGCCWRFLVGPLTRLIFSGTKNTPKRKKNMEIRFDNKRALVTGAGKGIGRGTVVALAKCGASVTAVTRSQADLDTLKQEVPGIETICLDVHDWDKTNEVLSSLPPFDLLVNSAGVSSLESCLDVSAEAYENVMMINHRAILQITKIVAKGMITKGEGGSIVNLSSLASLQGLTNHAVYASTKGALDSYTKVAALEFGKHKIRVNCVNPTVVLTPMARKYWDQGEMRDKMLNRIPLGRFLEVEDVVNPVLFLLSDKSAMINGIILPIDGGALAASV